MKILAAVSLVFFLSMPIGCSTIPSTPFPVERESARVPAQNQQALPGDDVSFFSTPEDAHRTWLQLIQSAKQSIFMEMFHLTDPDVVAALRAKDATVSIRLILDSGNLQDPATEQIREDLQADRPNISVYPSSGKDEGGFVQTHVKAMIVDGDIALITSINLTNNAAIQRDYGIKTSDTGVIDEMNEVFLADIQNSENAQNGVEPTRYTPDGVGQGKLIWSPVDSEARLVSLINESTQIPAGPDKFIDATVENLGDAAIQNALSSAAAQGVQVRIIVPQCVLGANGARNYDFFDDLKNGVQYRVMPHPSSSGQPYMHGKMLVLGNGRAYVGSVNYSKNSTQGNRELGIIFTHRAVADQIIGLFKGDWDQALDVLGLNKPVCPVNTSDPGQ